MASQRPLGADPLDSGHRHLSSAQISHPNYDRETTPQPRSWRVRVHWGQAMLALVLLVATFATTWVAHRDLWGDSFVVALRERWWVMLLWLAVLVGVNLWDLFQELRAGGRSQGRSHRATSSDNLPARTAAR